MISKVFIVSFNSSAFLLMLAVFFILKPINSADDASASAMSESVNCPIPLWTFLISTLSGVSIVSIACSSASNDVGPSDFMISFTVVFSHLLT